MIISSSESLIIKLKPPNEDEKEENDNKSLIKGIITLSKSSVAKHLCNIIMIKH